MAKTDYIFSPNKYFTGVEDYNIYTFLKDIFFKHIRRQGYPAAVVSQGTMAAILGYYEYEFTSGDAGNFSRNIRGETPFRGRGRENLYTQQKQLAAENGGWLGAVSADIPDRALADIPAEIQRIYSFFARLNEKSTALPLKEGLCKGFDKHILAQLLSTVDNCRTQAEAMPFNLGKKAYVCCLIAGITYFLSNGAGFLDLTQLPATANATGIAAVCAGEIPAQDFVTDEKLMAELVCQGKKYPSLKSLVDSQQSKNIFITADGGWGKTTAMRYAAEKLNHQGVPALYIACNKADNIADGSLLKDRFIADSIGCVFPQYSAQILSLMPGQAVKLLKSIIEKELNFSRMVVFVDGLNETAASADIARQIKELTDNITNLQFVISSRYTAYQLKNSCIHARLLPLKPQLLLTAKQYDVYKKLDRKTRQLLAGPMFMQMFLNSVDYTAVSGASLLMQGLERNLGKTLYPAVLKVFLPQFTLEYYLEKGKMVMTLGHITAACKNFGAASTDEIVETLKMSGYLQTEDDYSFVWRHEHIRDFFVALALLDKIRNSHGALSDTILDIFSAKKNYSIYIRRFFAELAGKDTVMKMLASLSAHNMDRQRWLGEATALATGAVTDLLKILTEGNIDTDLYGLNLTKTALNGCRITDGYFARSLVSDFTFSPKGHDSAVFALEWDERGYIYALGRNTLIKYSPSLEQLDILGYTGGTTVISHTYAGGVLGAVVSSGKGFIFSTKDRLALVSQLDNAVSVEKTTGGLLFGFDDGFVRFYTFDGDMQWEVKVDTCPVMPVKNRISSEILYATSRSLRQWSRRGGTHTLWQCDEDMQIINRGYNGGCSSAVLVVNRFGETHIMEYSATAGTVETVWEITRSAELADYLVQQSVGIDPVKCTNIAFQGGHMLNVYNNGSIMLFEHLGGGWTYTDSIEVISLKADNPGLGIESACFTPQGIVCGLTDRTVKLISCDFENTANNGMEKHRVQGHNNGLRRLCLAGDSLYAAMYDRGFVQFTKNSENNFIFKDKTMLDEDWCWAAVSIDHNTIAFASGYNVYIYDGAVRLCHSFKGKVENLFYKDGLLYVAVNSHVYTVNPADNTVQRLEADFVSQRRAISFATDKREGKVYVGYSSDVNNSRGCIVACVEKGGLTCVQNSLWKYTDGWYRSIEFSQDGRYILCAGLKTEADSGRMADVAVLFDRSFNILATFAGHTKSVLKGMFTDCNGDRISVATCSYDGHINIYTVSVDSLGEDCVVMPQMSSGNMGARLTDMVLADGGILACCLEGRIYSWDYKKDNSPAVVYENICGLWTSYCDLSQIDKDSTLSAKMQAHLGALNNFVKGSEKN